ncbi:lysophospholipid acyltransferase family protein [Cryptosporangium aurantiacum]|uniref:1-acyl-sn-glycerol-3-phosphate acyltransferases n=1 Tax=Cryptosporangium aurantiacum TaxID=134849 RepID=A0A1M7HQT1_9ACTN|nr:lysophospholipid acyltransferase family protein [Cryptosporangium aurantiacum]SHM30779.1 1-acyl-sn-glycerol-3-phosphate acyltransferases [Cryptosporangium aurantiacum]
MRRGFWLRFAEFILRPLLAVFTRRTWLGHENVPASGPAIFVANHTSWADPLVIAHFLYDRPREMRVLVKSGLFTVPLVRTVLRSSGQIPVHRSTRDAGEALRTAAARIRAGEAPLIYPEGTITRDPDLWPMQGKTGAARLFLDTGAPVIPIVQWGAHRIHDYRTGKIRLRPRTPVTVSAGAPVDLSAYVGAPPTGPVLKEITDVIMRRMRDDLAEVRGEPAPTGPLYVLAESPRGLAQ